MKLYDHQQKIIDADPKKAGLFLGTGSGKTRIAILLAKGSTLVICPKTQKEDANWEREYSKVHLPSFAPNKDIFRVISKETFRRDWETLPRFNTVIVDEAHTCLGVTPDMRSRKRILYPKTSQLFEALDGFIQKTKPERLYLATATIMKSPMTIYGAAKILGKDWDFLDFRSTYYWASMIGRRQIWQSKKDKASKERLAATVHKLGYVGRLEDYFDVPEQTYKTMYVDLTPEQKQLIARAKIDYPEPIVRVGKIHQIENGIVVGNEFEEGSWIANAKADLIEELTDEFPRMVIFARFIKQIELIALRLRNVSGMRSRKILIMTGQTKNRGELIAEANASDECIFIAQTQISAGWELPDFPVMVFASNSYSFVDRVQAEGRILRANKLKKNLYIDIVARGGVDKAVKECIVDKKDFDERLYAQGNEE